MTLNEMADDLEIYLKENKLDQFYIMAHSMGGRALLRFLEKKKDWFPMIKGVLIIDVLPIAYKNNKIIMNSYEKVTQISQLDLKLYKEKEQILQKFSEILGGVNQAKEMIRNISYNEKENLFFWKSNVRFIQNNYLNVIEDTIERIEYEGKVKILAGDKSPFIQNNQELIYQDVFINQRSTILQKIQKIPQCGHFIHLQKPEIVIQNLLELVQKQN